MLVIDFFFVRFSVFKRFVIVSVNAWYFVCPVQQFGSQYIYVRRGSDTQLDTAAVDLDNRNHNIVSDVNGLVYFS
jgi:hypothetical protein